MTSIQAIIRDMETESGETRNLAPILRKARVAAGITQAALAAQAGCKQSAVSMYEAGKRDALSRDSIVKIAAILKVELPTEPAIEIIPQIIPQRALPPKPFCPSFDCPTNIAYTVGASVFLLPSGTAGNGKRCLLCGEALSTLCPKCGTELHHRGACCPECGTALIEFPDDFTASVAEWIQRHNANAMTIATGLG